MRRAVAPHAFEVHRIAHSAAAGLVDGVAGLVRTGGDPKALAAMREHLRHERKLVVRAVLVEGREYLRLRANLNPVSSAMPVSSTYAFQAADLNDSGRRLSAQNVGLYPFNIARK